MKVNATLSLVLIFLLQALAANAQNESSTEGAIEITDLPANSTNITTEETEDTPVGIADHISIEDLMASLGAGKPEQNFTGLKNPTIVRFTYGDSDPLGPLNWAEVPSGLDTTNYCNTLWYSPLKIETGEARLGEVTTAEEQEESTRPRLVFRLHPNIEQMHWHFGQPQDIYHGLQIVPDMLGGMQIYDDYNSHKKNGEFKSRMYDFTFAHISYCDYSQVSENRSSHQINDQKFPIEINLLFFYTPTEIGIDKATAGLNEDNYVMVTILGNVGGDENPRWDPIIEVAKDFKGESFEADYNMVQLKSKFSISWLIPRNTSYYYYNAGSFPVPPCFSIPRVYVLTEPISISEAQFEVLTHIPSVREPSGIMSCTFGLLQNKTDPDNILYNPHNIKILGQDRRPKLISQSIEQEEGNSVSRKYGSLCLISSFLTIYLAHKAGSQ